MTRAVLLSTIFLAMAGCATTFYGSAKVPDGLAGCKAKCSAWGMELSGMVAMGEYSDGCICQIPSTQQKAASGAVSAAGAAMAGVWIHMQAEQERGAATQTPHR